MRSSSSKTRRHIYLSIYRSLIFRGSQPRILSYSSKTRAVFVSFRKTSAGCWRPKAWFRWRSRLRAGGPEADVVCTGHEAGLGARVLARGPRARLRSCINAVIHNPGERVTRVTHLHEPCICPLYKANSR